MENKQTLTDSFGSDPWVADLRTMLGEPGVTYTSTFDSFLLSTSMYQFSAFEDLSMYGAGYFVALSADPSTECYTGAAPANCKVHFRTPLCTRYTYAAEKNNYPVTTFDTNYDKFVALPTSPTTCFPVTEFDLSR